MQGTGQAEGNTSRLVQGLENRRGLFPRVWWFSVQPVSTVVQCAPCFHGGSTGLTIMSGHRTISGNYST